MPCDYCRDDKHRILYLTASEPFSSGDVIAALDRQVADDIWAYGTLVDARRAMLSRRDDQRLLEHVRVLSAHHGPPGPVALVAQEGIGRALSYSFRSGREGLKFEVFWDMEDAERWLISYLSTSILCGCLAKQRLSVELLTAADHISALKEGAAGDGEFRPDLSLADARRRWDDARKAFFEHVQQHSC